MAEKQKILRPARQTANDALMYLLAKGQIKEADAYASWLENKIYQDSVQQTQEILNSDDSSFLDKSLARIGAGINSVAYTALGSPEYMVQLIGNAVENAISEENKALAPNEMTVRSEQLQEAALQGLTGTSKFVGELAISMANNLINTTVGSILGGGLAGTILVSAFSGSQAAAGRAADMYEQGATGSQQFWGSLGSGAAEALGEAISFGKLTTYLDSAFEATGGKALVKEFLLRTGGQLLTEGVEEMATEGMNILLDVAVMQNKSQLSQYYANYLQDNPNQKGLAVAAVTLEIFKQIGYAGLMGAVSGGIMGVGANTISLAKTIKNAKNTSSINYEGESGNTNSAGETDGTNNEDSPGASEQTTAQENSAALLQQQPANGSNAKAEGRNIVAYLKDVLSKIPKPGARPSTNAAGSLPVAALAAPAAAIAGEAATGQTQNMAQVQPTQAQSGQPLAQESAQAAQSGEVQQASKKAIPFLKKGETGTKAGVQTAQATQTPGVQQQGGAVQQATQAAQNIQTNAGGQTLQTQQNTVAQQAAQVAQQQTSQNQQIGQNQQTQQTTQNAQAEAATQAGQAAQTAGAQQQNAQQKEAQQISMAMATSQLQGGKAASVTLALARFITSMAQNSPFLNRGQAARGQLVAQLGQQWLAQNGTNFDSLSPASQRSFAAQLNAIQKTLPGSPNGAASLAAALPVGEYAAPAAQSGGQGAQTLAASQNPYALYASANGEGGGPPVAQGPATQGANGENTAGGGKQAKGKKKPKNQPNKAALAIMGVVIEGRKWNYTNPKGKLIYWTPQTQSDMQAKEGRLRREAPGKPGSRYELEAVTSIKEMLAEGALPEGLEIEGIDLQFKDAKDQHAGEIDILLTGIIVEVKASFGAVGKDQLSRYTSRKNEGYLNYDNRGVVYYIGNASVNTQKATEGLAMLKDAKVPIASNAAELLQAIWDIWNKTKGE